MLKHRTLLITGTNKNTGKAETLITRKGFPKEITTGQVYLEIGNCIQSNSWFSMQSADGEFYEMFDPREYSALSLSIQEV